MNFYANSLLATAKATTTCCHILWKGFVFLFSMVFLVAFLDKSWEDGGIVTGLLGIEDSLSPSSPVLSVNKGASAVGLVFGSCVDKLNK